MPRPRWILVPATALVAAAFAQPAPAAELCVHRAAYECPAGSRRQGRRSPGRARRRVEHGGLGRHPDRHRHLQRAVHLRRRLAVAHRRRRDGQTTSTRAAAPTSSRPAGPTYRGSRSGCPSHDALHGHRPSRAAARSPTSRSTASSNPGGGRAGVGLLSGGTLRRVDRRCSRERDDDHAVDVLAGRPPAPGDRLDAARDERRVRGRGAAEGRS